MHYPKQYIECVLCVRIRNKVDLQVSNPTIRWEKSSFVKIYVGYVESMHTPNALFHLYRWPTLSSLARVFSLPFLYLIILCKFGGFTSKILWHQKMDKHKKKIKRKINLPVIYLPNWVMRLLHCSFSFLEKMLTGRKLYLVFTCFVYTFRRTTWCSCLFVKVKTHMWT